MSLRNNYQAALDVSCKGFEKGVPITLQRTAEVSTKQIENDLSRETINVVVAELETETKWFLKAATVSLFLSGCLYPYLH